MDSDRELYNKAQSRLDRITVWLKKTEEALELITVNIQSRWLHNVDQIFRLVNSLFQHKMQSVHTFLLKRICCCVLISFTVTVTVRRQRCTLTLSANLHRTGVALSGKVVFCAVNQPALPLSDSNLTQRLKVLLFTVFSLMSLD